MYSSKSSHGLRLTTLLAVVVVALSATLIAMRVEQVLLEFAQTRSLRVANQLKDKLESGFRLGLSLSDQANLPDYVARLRTQDTTLAAALIATESGETVVQQGQAEVFSDIKPVWTRQLLGQGIRTGAEPASVTRQVGARSFVGVPAIDPSGRRVAVAWLAYDRTALRETGWQTLLTLLPFALLAIVVLAGVLGATVTVWMRVVGQRLELAGQAVSTDTEQQRAYQPADVISHVDDGARKRTGVWQEFILIGGALLLVCMALGALAWKAREIARPALLAQIDQNASTVLQSAEVQIERALTLGIPPGQLVGVDAMFAAELQPAAEIAFLSLVLADGQMAGFSGRDKDPEARQRMEGAVKAAGNTGTEFRVARNPVQVASEPAVGQLVIGTPSDYVDRSVRSILVDLLFAVVVSLILVRELMGGLWDRSVLKPYLAFESAWQGWRLRATRLAQTTGDELRTLSLDWLTEVRSGVRQLVAQAQARLQAQALPGLSAEMVRLRLIVFFTALSDELLRPFFAIFASEVSPVSAALSPTMLAGLPIATFMLTLALAQPLGPWLTRRIEVRRAMVGVALIGATLLALTALAKDGWVLMLLRAGSGMVYGLVLILSQTTIVRITDFSQRARGLVEVSAAIVAAGVCGPALGGLLVERFGSLAAFAACTACLLAVALISTRISPLPSNARGNLANLGGWRGFAAIMRQRRVMAVTWFAAVPARLAAAALLVVVTPLYLLELGEPATVSGRVLLLYFLTFMITAPLVARWSDISRSRRPWIIGGCGLSAVACAALPLIGGVVGAAICCGVLGIAQALLSAPQLALVTETFDRDPHATQVVGATPEQALAAFRFIERFGSVLAPFAVALAVAQFGLTGAVGVIGLVLGAGTVGVTLALITHKETAARHATA